MRVWRIKFSLIYGPSGMSYRRGCWSTTQFIGGTPVMQEYGQLHNIIMVKVKGTPKMTPKWGRKEGHHKSQHKILATINLWCHPRKPKHIVVQTHVYVEISVVWTHTWILWIRERNTQMTAKYLENQNNPIVLSVVLIFMSWQTEGKQQVKLFLKFIIMIRSMACHAMMHLLQV